MEESKSMNNAAAKDDTVPAEHEYQENEENVETKDGALKWKFRDEKNCPEVTKSGKRIRNKIKKKTTEIRIDKKKTKLSSNYEMKVTCESKFIRQFTINKPWLNIGLIIDNDEEYSNMNRILFYCNDGKILDKCTTIKRINKTLEKYSIIKVSNEMVKKTNSDEWIFQVSITINDAESVVLFYQAKEEMVPFLHLNGEVELDVEISNLPYECIQDIAITKDDPPLVEIEKLQNNVDLSIKVSKSYFSIEDSERAHDETFLQYVVEADLKFWSVISNAVSRNSLKQFFSTCKTKLDFLSYLIKSMKIPKLCDQSIQILTILVLCSASSQETIMYMSRLDSNSFDLSLDSSEKSFRITFSNMLYEETNDYQRDKDIKLSNEFPELKQVFDLSMKYNEYAFEYENLEKTMISDILIEDIRLLTDVFKDTKQEEIKNFFTNTEQKSNFFQYLIKALQIYIKSKDRIPPISLFSILNTFCDTYEDIFGVIQELYPYQLKVLRNAENEDYEEKKFIDESSVFFKPKSTMKLVHSVLTDQYYIELFWNKATDMHPLFGNILGNRNVGLPSWIVLTIESELTSVLSYDLFEKHLKHVSLKRIKMEKNLMVFECLKPMLKSKVKFQPKNFHLFLFAFSESCDDIYVLIQRAKGDMPDQVEISSYTLLLHSLLSDEKMLDLFCQKSPQGCPFTGQIEGRSWLYHVLECGLTSVISTELTTTYMKKNQSDSFDVTKSTAVECISKMIESNKKFNPENYYQVLFACSNSCQNIHDIINGVTKNKKETIDTTLIFLYTKLSSEKLFVDLFFIKSSKQCPFHEQVNGRAWLSTVIELEQLNQPILSYIFANKQQDVINMINASEEESSDISRALMALLLDKTDNYRMLRRDFFKLLTREKDRAGAIAYVKNHSNETSIVSLKAVQEIKDLYDFSGFQKFLLFITLLITFLAGSLSYGLDVGSDYGLLYKSYNCTFSDSMTQPMNDTLLNHTTNTTSKCFPTDFCNFTKSSVNYYFQYTLIVCLMPFLLNILLVANDIHKNKDNSLICLPLSILKHYSIHDKHPYLYHVLRVAHWSIWCPFLILLYPIATKFAYVPISYMVQITSRSLTVKKQTQDGKSAVRDNEVFEKAFFDKVNNTLSSEVLKSSTLEVVTESTLQPLLQLYAITSTCDFTDQFTFGNLFSLSMFSNPLLFSIVTSLLAFAWSLMTYHVYVKQGALNTDVGLKARLLMFLYFLTYIISRMFILIISAHQIFGSYENLLFFIIVHAFLMCIIHNVHLYKMNIGGNYGSFTIYVKTNYKSLAFWIESLINSVGCILIPNNIKYPRREGDKVNKRYHEATSFRYLSMHLTFLIENVALVIMCQLNFRSPSFTSTPSPLYDEFENPKENSFIRTFPYWSLGMFISALILKFLYYQTHAWPISPNCFTMKFLRPFDEIRNGDECRGKEKVEQTEELKVLLETEPEPLDESKNDFQICSKEGIELGVIVDQPKTEIECFICEECFNSMLNLDEHLLTKHRVDQEKHEAYWKWRSNKMQKMKDDVEVGYCCW